MSSEHDLVLLFEGDEPTELALVRNLLDAEDIKHVVQGEHHAAVLGGMFGDPSVRPRVLVAQRDLAKAQGLVAASPLGQPLDPNAVVTSLEGEVCPVHEKPATTACGRCSAVLCAECQPPPGSTLCEDCAKLDAERPAPSSPMRNRRKTFVLALLGVTAMFMLLEWFGDFL